MLDGVNDSLECAEELRVLLKDLTCHVNLMCVVSRIDCCVVPPTCRPCMTRCFACAAVQPLQPVAQVAVPVLQRAADPGVRQAPARPRRVHQRAVAQGSRHHGGVWTAAQRRASLVVVSGCDIAVHSDGRDGVSDAKEGCGIGRTGFLNL